MILLLGCIVRQTANVAPDLALPETAAVVVVDPPEPWPYGNARVAGRAPHNRPSVIETVRVAGPVEALFEEGGKLYVLANGVPQALDRGLRWTAMVRATAFSPGLWAGVEGEWVRLAADDGREVEREAGYGGLRGHRRGDVWMTTDGVMVAGKKMGELTSSAGSCVGNVAIFLSMEGDVIAVDTGERWRTQVPGVPVGGPVCTRDGVYITVSDGVIRLGEAGGWRWHWRRAGIAGPVAYGPDGDGGSIVYVGRRSGEVTALNAETGEVVWEGAIAAGVVSLTVVDDGVLAGGDDGALHALEAADGGERWKIDVGTVTVPGVRLGDHLYIGTAEGMVVALQFGRVQGAAD